MGIPILVRWHLYIETDRRLTSGWFAGDLRRHVTSILWLWTHRRQPLSHHHRWAAVLSFEYCRMNHQITKGLEFTNIDKMLLLLKIGNFIFSKCNLVDTTRWCTIVLRVLYNIYLSYIMPGYRYNIHDPHLSWWIQDWSTLPDKYSVYYWHEYNLNMGKPDSAAVACERLVTRGMNADVITGCTFPLIGSKSIGLSCLADEISKQTWLTS